MNHDFWKQFDKPILAMAPMAGITDSAFRQMCRQFGADIVYSEMASSAALSYAPVKTLDMLGFDESERPYIVQLFGSDPKHFEVAAKIVTERLRPDGIDINFGCPVPKVAKQGAGAALFPDIGKSREIIRAVAGSTNLPVSIKIRSGVRETDALHFLDAMSGISFAAVMIHGRTLAQGFAGPIDCGIIKKARGFFGGVILANGGINDADEAERILLETGSDGLGLGRGALGRPWVFSDIRERIIHNARTEVRNCPGLKPGRTYARTAWPAGRREVRNCPDLKPGRTNIMERAHEIFPVALEHARLSHALKGRQGIIEMRKHLCWYVQGMPDARRLRERFVKVESLEDVEKILTQI